MILSRAQLPVWSPVTLGTVAAGAAGLLRGASARTLLSQRLRTHFDAQAACLTDSGTSALALGLAAAARARGNLPVALPAYGCWDLASAAAAGGVRVRLYDVDPSTLAPDPASLQSSLRAGVSAVVVAYLYGMSFSVEDLAAEVRSTGAVLIEDAAQAFGATMTGRPAGCLGDLTVLSFGRGKGLTGGSGGALLARGEGNALVSGMADPDESHAGATDLIAVAALWLMGRPQLYSLPASIPQLRLGETVYREPHAAVRQSNVSAAAVTAVWRESLAEADVRRSNATRLQQSIPLASSIATEGRVQPGFLRLPVLVPANAAVCKRPEPRRLGIFPGYPTALCDLPQLRSRLHDSEANFAGARELARRLITLPTHSRLHERDLRAIEAWLSWSFDPFSGRSPARGPAASVRGATG